MNCPKCGGNHVNVQMVQDMQLKTKHRSIVYWIFVGWWWVPIKWLFFTVPALIIAIFKPKKQKIVTKNVKMFVCQDCGYDWKA